MSAFTFLLLFLAAGLSLLIHFLVIDLTHKKGIFLDDFEKIQKAHSSPTPRIGGLGIFWACMLIIYDNNIGSSLMLASIPAFISGFLEDYSGRVAPLQRLAIMILSPILCIIFLPESMIIHVWDIQIPYIISIGFTVLLSIAMVNGVNFIDGQNGLASGSILITNLGILALGLIFGNQSIIYISAVISVSTFVFLCFNYPIAKIFLGDGGAYFLGFISSILTLCLYSVYNKEVSLFIIPVLLIYPLWEVIFSTFRKLFFDKISPLQSDKYHLHQLIFRNQAHHKHHIPSLVLLPMQALITCLGIIFYSKDWILLLLILAYITLYTLLYIYTKRAELIKRAQLLNNKAKLL